jgi:hypothetical protein
MSQAAEQVKVRELRRGDKAHMYGTVVEILGPWFVPEGESLQAGWGRLPMKWDGLECAPPEQGGTEVKAERGERDS